MRRRWSDVHPGHDLQGSNPHRVHVLGQADWKAQNGECRRDGAAGRQRGWLVLIVSYQDVELFTNFRCTGRLEDGILFRATKTAEA